jgi:para-aminobenzoate synthetase component 1
VFFKTNPVLGMNNPKETIFFLNKNSSQEADLMAIGVQEELTVSAGSDCFQALNEFLQKHKKWVFGFLSYDLKNQVENLSSNNHDGVEFPEICFIVPKVVYSLTGNGGYDVLDTYDKEFSENLNPYSFLESESAAKKTEVSLTSRTPKDKYLNDVGSLLNHIKRGDIYEANYCVEFYHGQFNLAPLATYKAANNATLAPYSAYLQHGDHHAICCSPELYLEKKGSTVVSKPIKGTIRRGTDPQEDEELKRQLFSDKKERSENVMIVDLVRNDLSKTAKTNSVTVNELYGIHTFKTLHHMISTVTSQVADEVSNSELLKSTFPMGSMTGAPKISAMNLIEQHEDAKRGLYSGAIGFFTPEGDFTFNVVIRSFLYNSKKKYLSLMAGSAITAKSVPENEYRECLLKVSALKNSIHGFD